MFHPRHCTLYMGKAAAATTAGAVIVLFCLLAQTAVAQPAGTKRNPGQGVAAPVPAAQANAAAAPAILLAQLPALGSGATESDRRPKAMRFYDRAVVELHNQKLAEAEKDALRAAKLDRRFADASALAATAALAQMQFPRAMAEATRATDEDAKDEKAWVILATADNYLGRYEEAAAALGHVAQVDRKGAHAAYPWQAAYQWARSEAGQEHGTQALEWSNVAALTAPAGFAPLHLLRASALLAAGQCSASADELETYLQLVSETAPGRAALARELRRLRELSRKEAGAPPEVQDAGYNALAN